MLDFGEGAALIDMHCHVLPGIDDGCKSTEESLELLRLSAQQQVTVVAATPHYYSESSVADFLARRQSAYMQLLEAAEGEEGLPQLRLGAEVAYHAGLIYEERLGDLCYQGTDYLLLEMPFSRWTPNILRDVERIPALFGLTPVIAHLERYLKKQDGDMIRRLTEMDVLIQINAEYIRNSSFPYRAKHMLRAGKVDLLGSDSHDPKDRKPDLGPARERILAWKLEETLRQITRNSAAVLGLDD